MVDGDNDAVKQEIKRLKAKIIEMRDKLDESRRKLVDDYNDYISAELI